VDALTEAAPARLQRLPNPVIHGMWIGSRLSRLELLTITSFIRQGHDFNLWAYDDIETPLPPGCTLRDAQKIMPRKMLFRRRDNDPETGIGAGSLSGVSSDLFRYRLLHEQGGIWVDMDVTCLRPFTFTEPYLFRAHRVGAAGSILKAPRGCKVMQLAYEATAAIAGEDTPWLEPLRILTRIIQAEGLQDYVRDDIANPDLWSECIRPLTERFVAPPQGWYAIHWMNEFFRTLRNAEGRYKGRRIIGYTPDKEAPQAGSTLHELYRLHGLVDPYEPFEPQPKPKPEPPIILAPPPAAVDILVATLTRGGAERIVVETAEALAAAGVETTVYVVSEVQLDYPPPAGKNLTVHLLTGAHRDKLRAVALKLGASGRHVLQTHLIPAADLQILWDFGIETIPVIHNARPGWRDAPADYNHPSVKTVVAVADIVAGQLRESGLARPVVTLRHEIQRRPEATKLAGQRRAIRRRHDIGDDTLLLGMVGQFKLQKAYPRAIRILAGLRRHRPAKLLIIGSWDHDYGSGRAAYEATMRLAVELGVVADVITPGNLHPVEPYYPAFDIFLSTSIFEGLSISLLEAISHGCKIIAADAGGNREVLPPDAVLVGDGGDTDAYVTACLGFATQYGRDVPAAPPEPDLIARLWSLLCPDLRESGSGVLFLTQNLQLGGPQRSLVNLLSTAGRDHKWLAGTIGGRNDGFAGELAAAAIPLLAANAATLAGQAEAVLHWLGAYRLGTLCFWNVAPELKLLLAKLLRDEPVRLIDVSPGPMLFDELDAAKPFQKRIAFTEAAYFTRLDHFVALYDGGLPDPTKCPPEKTSILPLGVPPPPSFIPLPAPGFLISPDFDPELAIGTCCRIVPDKRVEFLFEMMDHLAPEFPGASLAILGGADAASVDYFKSVIRGALARPAIRLLGPHDDVRPFLRQLRVFVMVSDRQGCPNASLEAMAMGLPVVANDSGGTAEQVIHGVTGYLAGTPRDMANRVRELLRNPRKRARMGDAARAHVAANFSMPAMRHSYEKLFEQVATSSRSGDQKC
jgi:glycosyltransferase involved in cell wall biosynthesis